MKFLQKQKLQLKRQIEGRNPVLEALRGKTEVREIIIEEKIRPDERIREIRELSREKEVKIKTLRRFSLDKISKTQAHQGVIGWAEYPEEPSVKMILEEKRKKNQEPFFVILPEITYEQNLGAVLRTAEAGGVDGVIVSHRAPQLTPVVSRVSMGASEHLPLIHENIFSVLKLFKEEAVKLVAALAEAGESIYKTNLTGPIALIIGNESKGISSPLLDKVDLQVKIPMFGRIGSLNLSVASAVLIYEVVRQRRFMM